MKTSTFKNLAWLLTLSLAVACNKTTEEIKRVEKVEKVEKVENQLISQQERRNLEMLLEILKEIPNDGAVDYSCANSKNI